MHEELNTHHFRTWLHAVSLVFIAIWWIFFIIWQPGFVSLIQELTFRFSVYPTLQHSVIWLATNRALMYSKVGGARASDIFFTQQEVSHLVDVSMIYRFSSYGILIATIMSWSALLLNIWKKRKFNKRSFSLATGILLFILIIGIVSLTSFDTFFIHFHLLLFPQGNWEFPDSSMLITLFPELFWRLMLASIVVLIFIFSALYLWISRYLIE